MSELDAIFDETESWLGIQADRQLSRRAMKKRANIKRWMDFMLNKLRKVGKRLPRPKAGKKKKKGPAPENRSRGPAPENKSTLG